MAVLTYVTNVADYFRELVDEPSQGFMTDAIVHTWLQAGFDQYHNMLTEADPERFILTVPFVVSNVRSINLATVIMGPAVTSPRMYKLVRVVKLDTATNLPDHYYYPVASREQLDSYDGFFQGGKVLLANTTLHFDTVVDGTIRVDYVGQSATDWTKTAPADTEWIDDLISWHDLIALYAALQYFASAGFDNPQIVQLLNLRQQAYKSSLQRGRSINAARYVHDDDAYGW
jgi:hypothetical protein